MISLEDSGHSVHRRKPISKSGLYFPNFERSLVIESSSLALGPRTAPGGVMWWPSCSFLLRTTTTAPLSNTDLSYLQVAYQPTLNFDSLTDGLIDPPILSLSCPKDPFHGCLLFQDNLLHTANLKLLRRVVRGGIRSIELDVADEFVRCIYLPKLLEELPRLTRKKKRRVVKTRKVPRKTKLSNITNYDNDLDDSFFDQLIDEVRLPTFKLEDYSEYEEYDKVISDDESWEEKRRATWRLVSLDLWPLAESRNRFYDVLDNRLVFCSPRTDERRNRLSFLPIKLPRFTLDDPSSVAIDAVYGRRRNRLLERQREQQKRVWKIFGFVGLDMPSCDLEDLRMVALDKLHSRRNDRLRIIHSEIKRLHLQISGVVYLDTPQCTLEDLQILPLDTVHTLRNERMQQHHPQSTVRLTEKYLDQQTTTRERGRVPRIIPRETKLSTMVDFDKDLDDSAFDELIEDLKDSPFVSEEYDDSDGIVRFEIAIESFTAALDAHQSAETRLGRHGAQSEEWEELNQDDGRVLRQYMSVRASIGDENDWEELDDVDVEPLILSPAPVSRKPTHRVAYRPTDSSGVYQRQVHLAWLDLFDVTGKNSERASEGNNLGLASRSQMEPSDTFELLHETDEESGDEFADDVVEETTIGTLDDEAICSDRFDHLGECVYVTSAPDDNTDWASAFKENTREDEASIIVLLEESDEELTDEELDLLGKSLDYPMTDKDRVYDASSEWSPVLDFEVLDAPLQMGTAGSSTPAGVDEGDTEDLVQGEVTLQKASSAATTLDANADFHESDEEHLSGEELALLQQSDVTASVATRLSLSAGALLSEDVPSIVENRNVIRKLYIPVLPFPVDDEDEEALEDAEYELLHQDIVFELFNRRQCIDPSFGNQFDPIAASAILSESEGEGELLDEGDIAVLREGCDWQVASWLDGSTTLDDVERLWHLWKTDGDEELGEAELQLLAEARDLQCDL